MIRRVLSTKSQVKLLSNVLEVGGNKFHYAWLRDNCQCQQCIHPSTNQKLHSSGQVNSVKPHKVQQLSGNRIEITWPKTSFSPSTELHKSVYELEWLEKYNYQGNFNYYINSTHWDAEYYSKHASKISYEEFMSESGFQAALEQLRDFGLCFLENVPTSVEDQVEEIGKRFGQIQETFYGKSWNVRSDPNSKNIAYTSLFLGLHMDLMYLESPPGLQILHCIENTVEGGTSLFLDLFPVIEKLKTEYPTDFEILSRVPVRFHYVNDGKHYEYLRPTISKDVNYEYSLFYSPPFQGPLHASPNDVEGFYQAFKKLEKLLANEKLQLKYRMNPGDAVLFANRRVLHGRDSFDNTSGSRWFRGTYVAWDEVKNEMRTRLK